MAKILISLPSALLAELDIYCKDHKYNRSELIRFVVRKLIEDPVEEETGQSTDVAD